MDARVRKFTILFLRLAFVLALIAGAWLIYSRFPSSTNTETTTQATPTRVQIALQRMDEVGSPPLDISFDLYPVDIVAVRHEFFTEPRAGKRFDDFLKDRMRGRKPVTGRLDRQGRGTVVLPPGNWWLHAKLSGDQELEWRLPVSVSGPNQTVELSPQNAYSRSKSF
jgi:hypothetical protein